MKSIKYLITGIILIVAISFSYGQPNPPDDHGSSDNQGPGGNAPIASGITILLTLGAAYGGRKTYQLLKQENTDN